jgi:hypothetical protein
MSKNLEKLKYIFLPCVFFLIQWVLFTKYFHKEIKQLFSKVFLFFSNSSSRSIGEDPQP